MFTDTHQELIRGILKDMTARSKITLAQRRAIRQCCIESAPVAEPEKLLIAFKRMLAAAAESEQIPAGVERDAMLSQLVSIFIDELYATHNDDTLPEISLRKDTPASAPRLVLDNDSVNTHL
jgi:hypothetical protein